MFDINTCETIGVLESVCDILSGWTTQIHILYMNGVVMLNNCWSLKLVDVLRWSVDPNELRKLIQKHFKLHRTSLSICNFLINTKSLDYQNAIFNFLKSNCAHLATNASCSWFKYRHLPIQSWKAEFSLQTLVINKINSTFINHISISILVYRNYHSLLCEYFLCTPLLHRKQLVSK